MTYFTNSIAAPNFSVPNCLRFCKTGTMTFISLNLFYQIRPGNLLFYIVKSGLFREEFCKNTEVLSIR